MTASRPLVQRKVVSLIVAQVAVGTVATAASAGLSDVPFERAPGVFVAFVLALAGLNLLPPVYVELRRHGSWVTPTDAAYVVGLVALGPVGFVAAIAATEILTQHRLAQSVLKRVYNLTSITAGAALGAAAFAAVADGAASSARSWVGALIALAAIGVWDATMTASVLAISEGERYSTALAELAPPIALTFTVSAPLGLIALLLYDLAWPAVLLLVPVLATLAVASRATLRQRAQRQRLQRLAEASAQLVELADAEVLLTRIASLARELVTGSSSLVAVLGADEARGHLVDDDGGRPATGAELRALREVTDGPATLGHGERSTATLDPASRTALPPSASITWAATRSDDAAGLLVAVFREFPPDGQEQHRTDLLATFIAQAATALRNAHLHAQVQARLEHERATSQVKDDFVAVVSHELRTPLTSIMGAMETVRDRGDQLAGSDREQLLGIAMTNSVRLRGLIEDLLAVSELDQEHSPVRHSPVDLAQLVREIAQEHADRFDNGLHVEVHVRRPSLRTDELAVRRITAHLLDNARKYAPDGPVRLAATDTPGGVAIEVSDSGPGIADDEKERVFGRFVQLDSSSTRGQGGLGLGLHLSRRLAAALGGRLELDVDGAGTGARFVLTLPDDTLPDDSMPDDTFPHDALPGDASPEERA